MRLHPKITYEDLRRITSLNFANETLRTISRDHHILDWRSKKRPALTETKLAFARAWLDFDWLTVLFLDECSVEKGVGKETTWSFGYPHEEWTTTRSQSIQRESKAL